MSVKQACACRASNWADASESSPSLRVLRLESPPESDRGFQADATSATEIGPRAVEGPPRSSVRLRPRAAERRARSRLEDAAYVRAALEGDPAAPSAIFKRFQPLVRYSLSRTLSGPDLEDYVQEVFARCFAGLGQLRDPSSLRSFIIGIALRFASTERRRRRLRSWERLTGTGELPEQRVYQDEIEARHTVRCMRELLGRVRADSCRALELRFVHENELTEVASHMGVSLATAKRHLARASACVRAMALGEPVLAEYLGRKPT